MITLAYESFINDIANEVFGLSQKERDENKAINDAKNYLLNKSNYNQLCEKFKKHAVTFIGDSIYKRNINKKLPIPTANDFEISKCNDKNYGKVSVNQMRLKYIQEDGGYIQVGCSMRLTENFKNNLKFKYDVNPSDVIETSGCISSYDITHNQFTDMYDLDT